jgi:DNA mismatch repair ATPase MutS
LSAGKIFGLALVDLTTGDFMTTELENDSALLAELERLRPAEIIFPAEAVRELAARFAARRVHNFERLRRLDVRAGNRASSPCASISRSRRSTASG